MSTCKMWSKVVDECERSPRLGAVETDEPVREMLKREVERMQERAGGKGGLGGKGGSSHKNGFAKSGDRRSKGSGRRNF